MEYINHSCQGESHKSSNKECQDYSLAVYDSTTHATIAVVCDGHGGDSYFRSAVGAKVASEITVQKVVLFLQDTDSTFLKNCSSHNVGVLEAGNEDDQNEEERTLDVMMRRLFKSIYAEWRYKIEQDAARELTEWELDNVQDCYRVLLKDEEKLVKVYGCTLMAVVWTPSFWFGFHIGDGKFVMLDHEYKMSQPIPWDEKCFLNKTTSLCDEEPFNGFRYCINVDAMGPVAFFLGSDGIDDTYGDGDKLYSFYGDIIKHIAKDGQEAVLHELETDLPKLSERGSKDDMSLAVVYDPLRIETAAIAVNDSQMITVRNEMKAVEDGIQSKEEEIRRYKDTIDSIEKLKAELCLAEKELVRDKETLRKLDSRLSKLKEYQVKNDGLVI